MAMACRRPKADGSADLPGGTKSIRGLGSETLQPLSSEPCSATEGGKRYVIAVWSEVGNSFFVTSGLQVGFVLGDMANPEADLPAVLKGAMVTVTSGFLLMNVALYVCLPIDVIRTSSTVAVVRHADHLGEDP